MHSSQYVDKNKSTPSLFLNKSTPKKVTNDIVVIVLLMKINMHLNTKNGFNKVLLEKVVF